jgi:O-antigen ligase
LTETLARRSWLAVPLLSAAAVLYGALIAKQPMGAVGVAVAVAVAVLAFTAPVTHLAILLFLTTIVPYSLENAYGIGGGSGAPGLLAADLFLVTGLARAAVVLPQLRLDARRMATLGMVVLFSLIALAQAYHGFKQGRNVSDVGAELRTLMGFSTALIGLVVLDGADAHRRLARALVVLGLLLGLWGIAQWALNLPFGTSGDFGVRQGVSLTTSGRGQVQGGLFAFPIAVIVSAAVLMTGQATSRLARTLVVAVLVLNVVSVLLTFERTFWVVTVFGVVVVLLREGRVRRGRAVLWMAIVAVIGLSALATVAPGTLQTARQRLLSIGQYQSDDSVRYRRVESEHVIREIARAPLAGSGLAATIWWGQPWTQTPATTQLYTHDGYLWLIWRLGLIGAAVLFGLLFAAVAWRGPPRGDAQFVAIRSGSQASLLALLIASVTFPTFNGFGITFMMGLLLAILAQPRVAEHVAPPWGSPAPRSTPAAA